jgi:hypothetical protein
VDRTMEARELRPQDVVLVEQQRLVVERVVPSGDLVLVHFEHWSYSLIVSSDVLIPSALEAGTHRSPPVVPDESEVIRELLLG